MPYKHKISLLTQFHGKITSIIRSNHAEYKFSPGTMISINYHVKHDNLFFLQSFDVVHIPLEQAKHHMYWLHHMLEVCYYFIPLCDPNEEAFYLLRRCFLFCIQVCPDDRYFLVVQRVCLIKLFIILGFYPEKKIALLGDLFSDIDALFLDSIKRQKVISLEPLLHNVTDAFLKDIDRWLLCCVYEHPCVDKFKTLSFL